ncbi:neuronal acetylcholine receptor subunit alpha-4-like [Branchiostoma floridae]|uniref:Neuronal acetylcholine receptor subunit alpha-4-like n=1 Tax=Branchiostoma floridae TaxID=7739 RepID=A0A9J7HVJ2_BRAFL|nr:neuronal acetylcholine receptor subunit alpha-4-like [Branchiostoma floridae]XP_035666377.1 neuronal acetylcholine receptor subunit alpha-4-like [Branchiostoma floridae]
MDRLGGITLLILVITITGTLAADSEERLVRMLFNESAYNPGVRPALTPAEVVSVKITLAVSQVISVIEKEEVMRTNVWVAQEWTDPRLSWNKEDYDHISLIRVPAEAIWRPDIMLFNNKDGQYDVALYTRALVYDSGYVYWLPPAIFTSECSINVRHFPFDKQNCTLQFGSWTYDKREVDLQQGGYVQDDFKESGEWAILEIPDRKVETDDNVFIAYDFMLARKPLFYIVNMIVPIILLTLLSIFVFYLPVDCGEKVGLCINILLALVVFLLLIADIIPSTSLDIPLIGRYLMFTMIFVTIVTVMTIYVGNVHFRSTATHVMSPWIRYIFLELLPKLMKMSPPGEEEEEEDEDSSPTWDAVEMRKRDGVVQNGRPPVPPRSDQPKLSSELREAAGNVQLISDHFKDQDDDSAVSDEWRFMAALVDRICLWLFSIILLVGTVVLFAEPWYEDSFQ